MIDRKAHMRLGAARRGILRVAMTLTLLLVPALVARGRTASADGVVGTVKVAPPAPPTSPVGTTVVGPAPAAEPVTAEPHLTG